MKRNMLAKKLMAGLLTGAMVLSMGGMTAFAETKDVTFQKEITKEANVYTPAVGTIDFTVVPATGGTNYAGMVVYDGIAEGVSFVSGASFAVSDGLADTSLTANVTLRIDTTKFYDDEGNLKPGIYRYTVKETDPNYDGLAADMKDYTLDVYVSSTTEAGDTFEAFLLDLDDPSKKLEKITNVYTTNTLEVEKQVEGNQGNKNKEFNFTITIKGTEGETYYVTKGTDMLPAMVCGEDGVATLTVALKDDESVVITGLSEEDTFTVVETEANDDGYITTYTLNGEASTEGDLKNGVVEGLSDQTVVVTNTKNVTTPTGIAMTFAPYVAMVVFAGVFAVMFLRKKREDF